MCFVISLFVRFYSFYLSRVRFSRVQSKAVFEPRAERGLPSTRPKPPRTSVGHRVLLVMEKKIVIVVYVKKVSILKFRYIKEILLKMSLFYMFERVPTGFFLLFESVHRQRSGLV